MASDLSSFFKDELANTLEQLLSKSVSVELLDASTFEALDDSKCVEISAKFEFSKLSSKLSFFIPTLTATKFEYFMLGGMGDLKSHIDDEIVDAVSEIISNICGSFCTAVNAQGFADVTSMKNEMLGSSIEDFNIKEANDVIIFDLNMDGEKLPIFIRFDEIIAPFLAQITVSNGDSVDNIPNAEESSSLSGSSSTSSNNLSSILSDEAMENLQLLFDIKLKLSVRLGTKNFLLKDILRWDIGEIIELEQMVNEPLEILVNGVKIGEGEAVIVEGKFGLKIKNIGTSVSRLGQIGL